MAHPLDEAHAKVDRAREHLKELDRKAVAFVDAHPYDIVPEVDKDTGQLVGIARARVKEAPVPLELGIIAGDVGHNLRSALNYLTIRLATPPVGTGPGDQTQWPIYFDQEGMTYKKPARSRFLDGQHGYLRGVRQNHRTVIEKAQPYHGGHLDHLAFLALLNNKDKHQVVTSTGVHARVTPPDLGGWKGKMLIRLNPNAPIYDGAEVMRVLGIEMLAEEEQVEMKFDLTYSVGFGDNPLIADTRTMWRSTRLIKLILRVFRDVI